jgi:DNA-binding transcriptional ArsR family regulator
MTVDKIFEALSSGPRRRILTYLARTDMTAGEIGGRFAGAMSQPAISKHLSILENSGLIWREKRGQNMHYGLRVDALSDALGRFLRRISPRSRLIVKPAAPRKRSAR